MEKFISNRSSIKSVPEDYVFPPETRPGNFKIPINKTIPIIDLSEAQNGDRTKTIQQIIKAAEEFGFFQVFILIFLFFIFHFKIKYIFPLNILLPLFEINQVICPFHTY